MIKLKKTGSALLALVIMFSISVSAFASDSDNEKMYSQGVGESLSKVLTASNIYLAETKEDTVIFSRGADEIIAPASLTKMLTALVCVDKLNMDSEITVKSSALSSFKDGYITSGLVVGETVTVDELMNLLLVPSENDVAIILAQAVSSNIEKFSTLMNEKAKELGCKNSNFVNPYGEDGKSHYTTAHDMYLIAKEYIKNPYLMGISNQSEYVLPKTNVRKKERRYSSTNKLLGKDSSYYYCFANGVKTGHTSGAGDCLISSVSNDSDTFIAIVMGTDDSDSRKFSECKTLLDYAKNNFSYSDVVKKGETAVRVAVNYKGGVEVVYEKGVSAFIMNDEGISSPILNIDSSINTAKAGEQVGTALITLNGKEITLNLVTKNDAPQSNMPLIIIISSVSLLAVIIVILSVVIIKMSKGKTAE